ncbi:DegT/DnrJ/EryC1/StrS family aminotransferase [Metasolibacillus sp.]|uniref:DegT/DnrJ/EryC1/StrS family aminotransferase n=1 Tax=Metasolibacillus sp. TaxID=2703680 RepID=UPI0025EEEEAB|nr:DegT/DnrJ/EryC1/StrS family aminotransferase [Metasolibacillus sp.]MCT6923383.1 DegT/DnrJ/EryC1/StrS family aminotransferase [Metasolibacillus sp.]MCT6939894.1 DegT/DnrJ/EryC1/StrS family aminotransferase [Metasolibacillus sp.]
MKIPMLDLSEQYQAIKEDILTELDKVMSSSQFILGNNVKKIEEDIAKLSNTKHGVGVANGSDAIHIALQAAGIGSGDEVITTAFTFFATGGSIIRASATPVFVDIDPLTYNIDPSKVEEAITEKTKAIIAVNLYGHMADIVKLSEIAKKHNLVLIEDAAQAIGAKQNGKSVGELSSAATYSFFPTKNLGAYGDGGMLVTSDDQIAENARVIRVHGSKPKYYHKIMGYNSRLDELQAAVLNVKLPNLGNWTEQRRNHAAYYTVNINEKLGDVIKTPVELDGYYHVYHQYTIQVENRDELQEFLKEQGISTMVYYPVPLHLQPVFEKLGYVEGDLPITEKAAREVLSLPMFPELKKEQQDYILGKLIEYYQR